MKRRTAAESLRRARQILLNVNSNTPGLELDNLEWDLFFREIEAVSRKLREWAETLEDSLDESGMEPEK